MHQKLLDLKDSIHANLSKGVDAIFESAKALADEHKVLEEKVKAETTNYLTLQTENTKTKEDTANEKRAIVAERSKLDTDRATAKSEIDNAVKLKATTLTEVESLKASIVKLTAEKADAEAQSAKVAPLTLVKQTLEKEIATINQTIADRSDVLAKITATHDEAMEAKAKEITDAQTKLNGINADIANQETIMVPRLKEINEREKASIEKAEALAIIQKRYEAMFKE